MTISILVVDNGSEYDDINQIRVFLTQKGLRFKEYKRGDSSLQPISRGNHLNINILKNQENLGYASAINTGLKLLGVDNFKWLLVLNNDTEVKPDSLINLLRIAEKENQIKIWAPVITYYYNPDLIWDIGGSLTFWGSRTFPGRKKARSSYPYQGFTERTFVTGCALLINSEIIKTEGFLTEKFFFGEEDYWFARLMQKKQHRMAVCWEAEIKHKVSKSIKKVSPQSIVPMVYIHNLNRLIDMKMWLNSTFYPIWKFLYLPYATFTLWWKNWIPLRQLIKFNKLLIKNSRYKEVVTREDFLKAKELFQ